jgi:hypothetical protein
MPAQRHIRIAAIPQSLYQPCSIPLLKYKVPDNPKFFIRELAVPKNAPDAMPILKAPVCGAQ